MLFLKKPNQVVQSGSAAAKSCSRFQLALPWDGVSRIFWVGFENIVGHWIITTSEKRPTADKRHASNADVHFYVTLYEILPKIANSLNKKKQNQWKVGRTPIQNTIALIYQVLQAIKPNKFLSSPIKIRDVWLHQCSIQIGYPVLF